MRWEQRFVRNFGAARQEAIHSMGLLTNISKFWLVRCIVFSNRAMRRQMRNIHAENGVHKHIRTYIYIQT